MSRRTRSAATIVLGVSVLTLAACTSTPKHGPASSPPSTSTPPSTSVSASSGPAAAVAIDVQPNAAHPIAPNVSITVTASQGKLTDVSLVNPDGKKVAGSIDAAGTKWTSGEVLGYSKTYALSAKAVNADGKAVTVSKQFTTVTPDNFTMPYFTYTGGYAMKNGATYGVGIVPYVHFDEPITDKKAAEAALQVTSSIPFSATYAPHWYWSDDQNVHLRPQWYWPSGAKITITAKVYGVQVGPGLYGQADQSINFTIGAKHVSIADDHTHLVSVYYNDKLMRRMPTSMGRGGMVPGKNGQQISLWTMNGTYTVITHENPAIMSSETYGLPKDSPYGYGPEKIYFATKISTDGIYLHQLETTVWAQGHTDVSHGCLNLNTDNATFFYTTSLIGDVVIVKNTGGPTINIWQGGEWSVPWATWVAPLQ